MELARVFLLWNWPPGGRDDGDDDVDDDDDDDEPPSSPESVRSGELAAGSSSRPGRRSNGFVSLFVLVPYRTTRLQRVLNSLFFFLGWAMSLRRVTGFLPSFFRVESGSHSYHEVARSVT